MDEYLFFQSHKKELAKQNDQFTGMMAEREEMNKTKMKFQSIIAKIDEEYERNCQSPIKKSRGSISIGSPTKLPKEDTKDNRKEFSSETMKFGLDNVSEKYKEQYMSAGFPPKICSLFVEKLNSGNRLKTQILDVGCGKGFAGELLKQMGFFRLTGIDCSKSLLQVSKNKNCYEQLDQVAFGMDYTVVPEVHHNKYDFVISSSMINNDGFDAQVFKHLLSCLKMGGFVIFATKLNFAGENQYVEDIKELTREEYWTYTAEHSFYRYDKNADGSGKFSNKMVKIFAYQKTDHDAWAREQEIERLLQEKIKREMEEAEEKRIKDRDAKLNKESKGKGKGKK